MAVLGLMMMMVMMVMMLMMIIMIMVVMMMMTLNDDGAELEKTRVGLLIGPLCLLNHP